LFHDKSAGTRTLYLRIARWFGEWLVDDEASRSVR
jgi:hypothetical protein